MSIHLARLLFILSLMTGVGAQVVAQYLPKFDMARSGLRLERRTHAGTFYDVVGRKSALAGYENRASEAWVYPLKILNDFKLSFRLEGYPLEIQGVDTMTHVDVRPESNGLTTTHAA